MASKTARSRILDALGRAGRPVTRGELLGLFISHVSATAIAAAMDDLIHDGLAERVVTTDASRPWQTIAVYQLRAPAAPAGPRALF